MNLYSTPPDTITVDGVEYQVETDFRFWVKFQGILLSDKTDEQRANEICKMMYDIGLPLCEGTLKAMLQFYIGASTDNTDNGENEKNIQSYDFEKDSEFIFSAFLDSYGIDLTTERLHWWRFKALFKSLPEDCQMCKIMVYRTIDIKKVPKEQRSFYSRMKQRYSLKPGSEYKTKEQMIEYVKKRQSEAQSRMPQMRSGEQSSMD